MKKNVVPAAREAGSHNGCDCFGQAHPAAQEVCGARSFNDWHPSFTPMIRLNDGEWATRVQRALPLVVA